MNPRLPLSPTDFQPSAPFRGSTDPSPEIQAGAAHHPLTLCPILPRLQSNPKPKFQREDSRLHLSVDDLSSTEPEAVTGYRSDGIIAVASVRVRPPKQPVTPRQEVLESGDEVAAAASADEVIAAAADSDQAASACTYSIYVLLSLGHKVYYEVLDKVFEAVVAYKRKLDSMEHFSLNLKPQEHTKHHHSCHNELEAARMNVILGYIDANTVDPRVESIGTPSIRFRKLGERALMLRTSS